MTKNFDVYDNTDKKVVTNQPSPVVVAGLKPATKYSGYKIAYTGEEAKTAIADFTTTNVAPEKPTLAAVAGDSKVDVTITDGQNLGTAITGRVVYWSTADGKTGTVDLGTSLTGSVTGLTNDTEYTLQAVCKNAAGTSEKSVAVKCTPVAPTKPSE